MIKKAAALLRSIACPEFYRRVNCQLPAGRSFSGVGLVILTFLFSLFTLALALPRQAHAQECDAPFEQGNPAPAQEAIDRLNKCAIEKNVFDDKIFNVNQIAGTVDSLHTLMFGTSNLHPETDVATRGGGALASSGKLVATLYSSPPVSGVEYFAQKIQQFNPVQPAYAQDTGGIGFSALQPVQKVWTVFRNISYIGFVLVFVIMGFMIMFRAHISPQAVATVQDSIPRIVIALILVTFSYAIAGLFIDVMFLLLNIIVNTLQTADLLQETSIGQDIFKQSVFGVVWSNWGGVFTSVAGAISDLIGKGIDLGALDWADNLFSTIGGGVAALVVGIALLFIMFRVFFMLLMAYVMIIVLTMVAPFFFLFQALPGRNGAGEWFKQMASQISVFPTVALMFVFAGVLGGLGGDSAIGAADTIGKDQVGQFPLLAGDIASEVIGKLIGIGLLLMTPSAAELVRNALGVKGGVQGAFGAAGAALGAGAGVAYTGSGARSAVGTVGGAFRSLGAESSEKLAARLPGGGGIAARRKFYEKEPTGRPSTGTPRGY